MSGIRAVALSGNPRVGSRTATLAHEIAHELADDDVRLIELASLGAALLDPDDPRVRTCVQDVSAADLIVVASPTWKGTYTGLLKLFLERFDAGDGLANVVSVPVMVGAGAHHALAVELGLKPLLTELGAVCPTPGLFVNEAEMRDTASWLPWVRRWRPFVQACIGAYAPDAG